MKKQIVAIFLLLCMTASILPASAAPASNFGVCGQNATWNFDKNTGTLSINGTGEMRNYHRSLYLSKQETLYPAPWSDFASEIKSVVISPGITSIGSYAFYGCSDLVAVSVPNGVSRVESSVFEGCNNLATISIPDSVTYMGATVFARCSSLETISIPDSVSFIGYGVFAGCERLEHITIPASITELYSYTFANCSNLSSITIPSSVIAIHEYAFKGCSSLPSVSIPDHVEKIDWGTFEGCSNMTSVYIPASVLVIGRDAFKDCASLTDIYYSGHKAQWSDINVIDKDLLPLSTATIHYEGGSDPTQYASFKKENAYIPGQFTDVPASSWYAEYVELAYEYGMMGGVSSTSFDPNGNLTVASAIAIACRLHSLYYKNNAVFSSGTPWYQDYVDYAQKNEIIDTAQKYAYNDPITRADFALLISNALPDSALQEINEIGGCDIPDVSTGSPYMDAVNALTSAGVLKADNTFQIYLLSAVYGDSLGIDNAYSTSDTFKAIYRLYRAGVLAGNDRYGTFTPDANITRSAVAAIVGRVAEPAMRKHIALTPKPANLVPMSRLQNLTSIRKRASNAELAQAYEAAKEIVEPLANLSREAQLCGISLVLRIITDNEVTYSMSARHYDDPYGFFNLHTASCAGCTRATGLCLNMLGIPYEHINENAYSHQWTRVNVNGTYWICDAYGLYCGPEKVPYQHPNL